jgi:hypothetical protein
VAAAVVESTSVGGSASGALGAGVMKAVFVAVATSCAATDVPLTASVASAATADTITNRTCTFIELPPMQ